MGGVSSHMRGKPSPLPAEVAGIAAGRHGIVTRRQVLELGMSASMFNRWRVAGHLHPLHRGVASVVPPSMLSREGWWLAAVLACGDGAALSHAAAGQLQWILPREERWALHVSVPRRSDRHPPGIVVHRPRSLPVTDLRTYLRIPTTTPTRSIWDLASALTPLRLRRAFEKAERRNELNRPRLAALLAESPTKKGAGAIRSLLDSRRLPYAETRSRLEDLLNRICSEHGLPLPAVNVPALGYEVDFLWADARFVVEADGGDHLTPTQRDRDNDRDIALGRAGYLVRRYSSPAMADEESVAAEVLAILRERLAP